MPLRALKSCQNSNNRLIWSHWLAHLQFYYFFRSLLSLNERPVKPKNMFYYLLICICFVFVFSLMIHPIDFASSFATCFFHRWGNSCRGNFGNGMIFRCLLCRMAISVILVFSKLSSPASFSTNFRSFRAALQFWNKWK